MPGLPVPKVKVNAEGGDELTSPSGLIRLLMGLLILAFLGAVLYWIVSVFVSESNVKTAGYALTIFNQTASAVFGHLGLLVLVAIIGIVIVIILRYLVPHIRTMMTSIAGGGGGG